MTVTSVLYENWRNIAAARVEFSPGINVLWGMNAQGKSNILEGIYYFARGRSFRGAKEGELVRFGEEFARAGLSFRRDGYENDTVLEAVLPLNGKKKLQRNGAPLSSAAEMLGSFRAVLFTPANLSAVTGGPLERRSFLDIALSQISADYLLRLRKAAKLLTERNALIRRAGEGGFVSGEEWEVYAQGLAECGAWIASYRAEYVSLLSDAVRRYFAGMTGGAETPELVYRSHALPEDMQPPNPLFPSSGGSAALRPDPEPLYRRLTENRAREIAAGSSLWGVHKDDLILSLNGREARSYASQGQQRSFVLSMKLGEAEIAQKVGGEYPAVLLDDVFSELDENRRRYILDALAKEDGTGARQIIVTSCEPDVIPGSRAAHVRFLHVEDGKVL